MNVTLQSRIIVCLLCVRSASVERSVLDPDTDTVIIKSENRIHEDVDHKRRILYLYFVNTSRVKRESRLTHKVTYQHLLRYVHDWWSSHESLNDERLWIDEYWTISNIVIRKLEVSTIVRVDETLVMKKYRLIRRWTLIRVEYEKTNERAWRRIDSGTTYGNLRTLQIITISWLYIGEGRGWEIIVLDESRKWP